MNHRLTGNSFKVAAYPNVRLPRRTIRFHTDNLLSRFWRLARNTARKKRIVIIPHEVEIRQVLLDTFSTGAELSLQRTIPNNLEFYVSYYPIRNPARFAAPNIDCAPGKEAAPNQTITMRCRRPAIGLQATGKAS